MDLKRLEETAYALLPNRGNQRCFHVAQITEKSRVLAIGFNYEKGHPKIKELGYWRENARHAELEVVLRGGREDYSNCILSVLRIDKNGKLNNSKPCTFCSKLIKQVGFKRVFYTNAQGKWEKFNLKNFC